MHQRLKVTCLGGLRVVGGADEISRFRTQKTALLAAYLACHPREHSRDDLLALLWPEVEPKAGRNSLSVALSSLRSQLEPPGAAAGTVVLADRQWVKLNPDAVTTDVAEFRAAVARSRRATTDVERLGALHDAVDRYAGPFLDGYLEDWVLEERRQLVAEYLDASDSLTDLLEAHGELESALSCCRRAAEAEPLREATVARAMRLLAALRRAEEALAWFADYRDRLESEVGISPGEAIWELAERIAGAADRVADRPVPPAAAVPAQASEDPPPSGTVTFLVADGLDPVRQAVLADEVRRGRGLALTELGESWTVVFGRGTHALRCAVATLRNVAPESAPRIALHTGEVGPAPGEAAYAGPVLQHARRLLAALHRGQIVTTETTATLLRADLDAGCWLTDLGRFRLDGDPAPKPFFSVGFDGMEPTAHPPLRAESHHASSLPLRLSRFFGRDAELARVDELILDESARLVTVTGTGGIGKTRLVLEAAKRLVGSFAGAVWFVELAEITRGEPFGEALREALRIPSQPGRNALDAVMDLLRRQPCLLVLDNFEQLVDAGADLVDDLLREAPELVCLVSSRQLLGLDGERELPLSPLPLPAEDGEVEAMLRCDSIGLFVDRVRAARPDFQLTESNRRDVVELCTRLEGIPLAMELAAARANVLAPAQILERLAQAFDLLASRRRDVPERHRTLRATFDWSYQLLTPELREFCRRLAVFRGGWSLEAAEAVCDEPLALDYLAQLREGSLIGTSDRGELRYSLLETIRCYAWERCIDVDETEALGRRHYAWYRDLARDSAERLADGRDDAPSGELDGELQNFRAAFDWALAHDLSGAYEFAGYLWRYWTIRGFWQEARESFGRLLARDEVAPELRARALGWGGNIAYRQADYAQARIWLEECLALSERQGEPRTCSNALTELGKVAWAQGDWDTAQTCFERALELRRTDGNDWSVAAALNNLGSVAAACGTWAAAQRHLAESLAIRRRLGDRRGIATSLNALGVVAYGQQDLPAAQRYQEECLALQRELGDRAGIAAALSDLGVLAATRGEPATARSLHEEALEHRRAVGDKRGAASSLNNLGAVCGSLGEPLAAQRYYQESIDIRREIGDKRGLALSLNNLGDALLARGDSTRATASFAEALALQREIGDQRGVALSLGNLAEAAMAAGSTDEAHELFHECLAAAIHSGAAWLRAFALRGLGDSVVAARPTEADLYYRCSLRLHQQQHHPLGCSQVLEALARLELEAGRPLLAGRLAGAAEAVRGETGAPTVAERRRSEQLAGRLREALGPSLLHEALAAGRRLAGDDHALVLLAEPGDREREAVEVGS